MLRRPAMPNWPPLAAWLVAALCLAWTSAGWADPNYPALSGRVVDDAHVLQPDSAARLGAKLKDLEDKSGIQLVVATVPSLGDADIESYANGLFRFWKLGEAKANNGVLLLVAPKERRVRIEVGYGEEGTLTDAISKVIITNAVVPRFKTGDFAGGIERGTDDIITVLTTDSAEWQKRPKLREDAADSGGGWEIAALVILVFIVVVLLSRRSASRRGPAGWGGGPWIVPPTGGSWSGGGWGGGGLSDGGGGGFSGGGGSSGGGGASGSW